jgi:formylmethanofuran dehydrogenase subunit B
MTCAGCGCVCDDGLVCPLGEAWLDLGERPPLARVEGLPVGFEEALREAAALLRAARAPLVYGLAETSIEGQRRAVALAEALGGIVDPGGSPYAFQAIGASTATLGEIRDRAELIVVWRADPATTHPRLLERLGTTPDFVVDETRTATAEQAREFVALGDHVAALWALRARITGAPLRADAPSAPCTDLAGAPPRVDAGDALSEIAGRLLAARHVAFIHGALDDVSALALASLVRDLNRERHAVTLALRPGNARGAEDVVAWQTGFAGAVSFARGFPRESPGAAELLARGEVDAALALTAGAPDIPTVLVNARAGVAKVAFAPAADGIEVAGTVHRMDGVPLPLYARQATDRPSVADVLAAIEARV